MAKYRDTILHKKIKDIIHQNHFITIDNLAQILGFNKTYLYTILKKYDIKLNTKNINYDLVKKVIISLQKKDVEKIRNIDITQKTKLSPSVISKCLKSHDELKKAIINYNKEGVKLNYKRSLYVSDTKNKREIHDYYPTPSHVTLSILKRVSFKGDILEPFCGGGAISRILINRGYKVDSFDLIDRNFGISGIDFLKSEFRMYDNCITNPPYKISLECLIKLKKIVRNKIAVLLPITFLESVNRHDFFTNDNDFPLTYIYQFSRRISLYSGGDSKGKGSGMTSYGWFVFERNNNKDKTIKVEPIVRWILD